MLWTYTSKLNKARVLNHKHPPSSPYFISTVPSSSLSALTASTHPVTTHVPGVATHMTGVTKLVFDGDPSPAVESCVTFEQMLERICYAGA